MSVVTGGGACGSGGRCAARGNWRMYYYLVEEKVRLCMAEGDIEMWLY